MTQSTARSMAAAPKKKPPVRAALPIKDIAMDTMTNDAAQDANTRAKTMFAEVGDRAKRAMERGTTMIEELNAFGKGNVEAIVESTRIAAHGIETMGQDAAAYTRQSFEGATAAIRTLAAVKSPTEFMTLQADYARGMMDAMIAETSRSTEAMLKLAGAVAQPISNRMAIAADTMKVAA